MDFPKPFRYIIPDMTPMPYELKQPRLCNTCVIFASPHSGRNYLPAFLDQSILSEAEIRSSEDAFVDELFACAPECGAPLLAATLPRAYLDVNRAANELDPALIEGVNRIVPTNPRVASGLGVVPRVVAGGRSIYRGKIPLVDARHRIETVWKPYHMQLQSMLDQNRTEFGQAILIDCHSMPHEAISRGTPADQSCAQVVLGDCFGASASGRIVDHVEAAFASAGFNVVRNAPFAGAHIARHYGRPSRRQHVVQVELDRALYMNEVTVERHAGFVELQSRLADVIREIAALGRNAADQIAAE